MQFLMRLPMIIGLALLATEAVAQHQDNRVDVFVNVFTGLYPIKLKGISDARGLSSDFNIPADPFYTTQEADAMVFGLMVQAGLDVNILMTNNMRAGIRAGGGAGTHAGIKNADGLESVALEAMGLGFYRRILGKNELTGLLGYKRIWTALPYHFVIVGVEYSWSESWGLMLSTSVNRHKYWRRFSNGFEEPAFTVRELGLTLVFRY